MFAGEGCEIYAKPRYGRYESIEYKRCSRKLPLKVTSDKLPELTVRFASEEYYRLLAKERGLARFFALGEKVVVVWQDRVHRVIK